MRLTMLFVAMRSAITRARSFLAIHLNRPHNLESVSSNVGRGISMKVENDLGAKQVDEHWFFTVHVSFPCVVSCPIILYKITKVNSS